MLRLLERKDLPEQTVINSSPKGGHNIHRVVVKLSDALESVELTPPKWKMMSPRTHFSCLIAFVTRDPGIYKFIIQTESSGGQANVRESREFTIVGLPKVGIRESPPHSICLHCSWPESLPLVQHLLNLPKEEFETLRTHHQTLSFSRLKIENGQLLASLKKGYIGDLKDSDFFPVNSPLVPLFESAKWCDNFDLNKGVYSDNSPFEDFEEYMKCAGWLEEYVDESQPRAPYGRACSLLKNGASPSEVLAVLEKAYERCSGQAKFLASYGCLCFKLGYTGHAKFYIDSSYSAAPGNPIIAALAFGLRKLLNEVESSARADYETGLEEDPALVFRAVCDHIENKGDLPFGCFPVSSEVFGESSEHFESYSLQRW